MQQNSGHDFDRWIDNRRGVLEEFQNNLVSSVEIWHLKNSVSRDGFRWNSFRNYFNSLFPLASKAWWFVVVETLIFSWRLSVGRLNFQFSNNVDVHFHVKWGLWSCDIKPCSSTYMYVQQGCSGPKNPLFRSTNFLLHNWTIVKLLLW